MKSQRLRASASSFRSPEICDKSSSIPEIVQSKVDPVEASTMRGGVPELETWEIESPGNAVDEGTEQSICDWSNVPG